MRSSISLAILAASTAFCGAVIQAGAPASAKFDWHLPKGFPPPLVPADNPMTAEKVELGRYLFYDKHLSVNGKSSCSTCHQQKLAFTDGLAVGKGATGELHSRGAMSLVNIAYSSVLTWSNPDMRRLEAQAMTPMFGAHPVELGLQNGWGFPARLRKVAPYPNLFAKAYPGEENPFTVTHITKAIACFERSILSGASPYDRYHYGGDDGAVTDSAKRGEELFFSEPCACFHCHGGFDFSDATVSALSPKGATEFHNNGLYNLPGKTSYPPPNVGISEFTGLASDVGKFKAPTLRNIALTAPYMHDGSIATLGEVIDHYAAGGRTIHSGPNAGVGRDNPNKDGRLNGFSLTPQGKDDLIAFLESLTDMSVTTNPRFADPWPHP